MRRRSEKFRYKIAQYGRDVPKPKRGEVVIIPEDNRITEIPPYIAGRPLPDWWGGLPKSKDSLRRCHGTIDYISTGFIIPMWTDVTIRPNSTGAILDYKMEGYGDDRFNFTISAFPPDSTTGCPIEHNKGASTYQYPKLSSPWRFITPKGVSLISLPVLHEPNPNYQVIPGIVHTDYYAQVHIVINVTTDKEFVIPAGTPMQHMIQFKRTENIKEIIWGNESMFKHVMSSGLGIGGLIQTDRTLFYRKKMREIDAEETETKRKKFWFRKK